MGYGTNPTAGLMAPAAAAAPRHGGSPRWRVLPAVLAVLGAALVLLRQATRGFTLAPDSIIYVSVARNLLEGDGFVRWSATPFEVTWPPGYPLLLALASLGLFDPLAVAGPLNAVVHGVTVFAVGHWLRRRLASRFLAATGCCVVTFGAPLISLTTNVLADSVFILCVALALMQTASFLTSGSSAAWLRAAACAGLAVMMRYAGFPLIVTIMAWLALQPGVKPGAKAWRTGVFALVALGPIGAWLFRNYIVWGAFTGMDAFHPAERLLADNAARTLRILAEWILFAPVNDVTVARGEWAVLAAWTAVAGLGFLLRRGHRAARNDDAALWVCQSFVLVYLGFICVATLIPVVPPPTHRYLAAIYIPLWFTLLFVADRARLWAAAQKLSRPGGRDRDRSFRSGLAGAASVVPAFTLAAWAGYGILVSARTSVGAPAAPSHSQAWAASPTLQYMQAHLATGLIFSNIPNRTYIQASRQTRHRWLPNNPVDDLVPWLTRREQAPDTYIVLFHAGSANHDYRFVSAADLRGQAGVESLAELTDGIVFKINPGRARRPDRIQAIQADFNARWRAITTRTPVVRSVFDVYLADSALHFVKQPCFGTDIDLKFILHAVPLRLQDLPAGRRPLGFENLDFYFGQYGLRRNDACLATVPLPVYGLDRIRVGQPEAMDRPRDGQTWNAEIPSPGLSSAVVRTLRAEKAAARSGTPVLRSVFDVYVTARAVRFVKTPCKQEDTQSKFILHVLPRRRLSLPRNRWQTGFDNLDFSFRERSGTRFEGQCWVSADLPAYAIGQLRVGQFDSERQRDVWKETISLRWPPENEAPP